MEDFEWEGIQFRPRMVSYTACKGCYFKENDIDCTKAHNLPHCLLAGKPYIFVETSQIPPKQA